jgi:hypothetical protein
LRSPIWEIAYFLAHKLQGWLKKERKTLLECTEADAEHIADALRRTTATGPESLRHLLDSQLW